MRPARLLPLALVLVGCHALRPALPTLVLQARLEHHDVRLAEDVTREKRAFVARLALRVSTRPPPNAGSATAAARGDPRPSAPCASHVLCAWEARARARHLRRLGAPP